MVHSPIRRGSKIWDWTYEKIYSLRRPLPPWHLPRRLKLGDKLPSCMAALEKSGMYRPDLHAEALGHPIAQARAREVAEELKNETPVLSIWSSPNMVDEFAQKIRARLI